LADARLPHTAPDFRQATPALEPHQYSSGSQHTRFVRVRFPIDVSFRWLPLEFRAVVINSLQAVIVSVGTIVNKSVLYALAKPFLGKRMTLV
jgi:hypothetical protein